MITDGDLERFDIEMPEVEVFNDTEIPSPASGIVLVNTKKAYNVAACIRAASCFQVPKVCYTGKRVAEDLAPGARIPREERMRGYASVEWGRDDGVLDNLPKDVIPVAVELRSTSISLPTFQHPEKAVYVFGPEDGHLDGKMFAQCHRHVVIPARHCLNLAAAVYVVLYDRMMKASLTAEELEYLWAEKMAILMQAESTKHLSVRPAQIKLPQTGGGTPMIKGGGGNGDRK